MVICTAIYLPFIYHTQLLFSCVCPETQVDHRPCLRYVRAMVLKAIIYRANVNDSDLDNNN